MGDVEQACLELGKRLVSLPGRLAVLSRRIDSSPLVFTRRAERSMINRRARRVPIEEAIVVSAGPPRNSEGKAEDIFGKHGQPPPETGSKVLILYDKWDLRIVAGDKDFQELGALIPSGYTLDFYGTYVPWDTYVLAER